MKPVYELLKGFFSIIGLLTLLGIVAWSVSKPSGTGWEWIEERKIDHPTNTLNYVSVERGVHDDGVDRVKVVLVSNHQKRELWSSYMKTKPEVVWSDSNTIDISYSKEESHSYWPRVTIGKETFNVHLSYK